MGHFIVGRYSLLKEASLAIWSLTSLIGVVCGLRAFTGIAATSWTTSIQWLDSEDSKFTFLGYLATPYIISILALGEFVLINCPPPLAVQSKSSSYIEFFSVISVALRAA